MEAWSFTVLQFTHIYTQLAYTLKVCFSQAYCIIMYNPLLYLMCLFFSPYYKPCPFHNSELFMYIFSSVCSLYSCSSSRLVQRMDVKFHSFVVLALLSCVNCATLGKYLPPPHLFVYISSTTVYSKVMQTQPQNNSFCEFLVLVLSSKMYSTSHIYIHTYKYK